MLYNRIEDREGLSKSRKEVANADNNDNHSSNRFLVVPFILIWLGVKNIKAKKQARGIIAIVLGALLLVPVIVIIMVMAFRVAIVVG